MFQFIFVNRASKKESPSDEEVLKRTITIEEFSAICATWMTYQKEMNGMKHSELHKLINPLIMFVRLYSEREGMAYEKIKELLDDAHANRNNEKGL